ncbi:Muskelin [Portunus trituberculatus]|uniref:Muskelin n=1 Tax=Portunus trituberculatus TaxID=210409 RepID=A0A5B7D4Z3_PORTR|nr:Muskelin [Portunus trituberculatus]
MLIHDAASGFSELARENSVMALKYLQTRLHSAVDHNDPHQVQDFQALATTLFQPQDDMSIGYVQAFPDDDSSATPTTTDLGWNGWDDEESVIQLATSLKGVVLEVLAQLDGKVEENIDGVFYPVVVDMGLERTLVWPDVSLDTAELRGPVDMKFQLVGKEESLSTYVANIEDPLHPRKVPVIMANFFHWPKKVKEGVVAGLLTRSHKVVRDEAS